MVRFFYKFYRGCVVDLVQYVKSQDPYVSSSREAIFMLPVNFTRTNMYDILLENKQPIYSSIVFVLRIEFEDVKTFVKDISIIRAEVLLNEFYNLQRDLLRSRRDQD